MIFSDFLFLNNRDRCLVLHIQIINVFLRLTHNIIGKQQDCYQVRYRHKCIQRIRDQPYQIQCDYRCDHCNCNIQTAVTDQNTLSKSSCKVFHTTLSVICPSDNGGICKGDNTKRQDHRSEYRNLSECQRSKNTAVRYFICIDIWVLHNSGYEYKACHQTYNYCIPESTCGGNKCLTYRVSGLCGCCCDRSGTHTRFIGEQTSRNTETHCHQDTGTNQTACCRARCEGQLADR